MRYLWALLKVLGFAVYCLLGGLMGLLVVLAFTAVGQQWLGVGIALAMSISFGLNLANI